MIAIRHTFAHLDMMPRCVVTRRIAHFCAHCTNDAGGNGPDGLATPASLFVPFHEFGDTHA